MPHLLVALSSHGFGHAAQTAPVVNALRHRCPDLRVTLRTTLAPAFLARRFAHPFELIGEATDFGMHMVSAVEVDLEQSARAYLEFHRTWETRVRHEAERLEALAPDLILANVPYLPLAAAATLKIPAVGLCSLNWADIYAHYFGARVEAAEILPQIRAAYASATAFLQPAPHMPMPDVPRRVPIGPIATRGVGAHARLRERLNAQPRERIVQVAPGGLELRLPIERWPVLPRVRYVVPGRWGICRADVTAFEDLGMTFPDALSASDALISKPGYGNFSEAGINGVPVLYVRRHDWPEEPYLVHWLEQHGTCAEVDRALLDSGELGAALAGLWARARKPVVAATGVAEATDYLASHWLQS